jgi:hypothetical protein
MLRTGHGNGAGQPRIEVAPADELPAGVPAPPDYPEWARAWPPVAPPPIPPEERNEFGRFVTGSTAAQRRGALAKTARRRELRALEGLGLRGVPAAALEPYLTDASDFARHEVERLAQCVGGGQCGAAPASLVQSAALALAASRYLYSTGDAENFPVASRLADSSRQNLLAAHELCAREAKARPQESRIVQLRRELGVTP